MAEEERRESPCGACGEEAREKHARREREIEREEREREGACGRERENDRNGVTPRWSTRSSTLFRVSRHYGLMALARHHWESQARTGHNRENCSARLDLVVVAVHVAAMVARAVIILLTLSPRDSSSFLFLLRRLLPLRRRASSSSSSPPSLTLSTAGGHGPSSSRPRDVTSSFSPPSCTRAGQSRVL